MLHILVGTNTDDYVALLAAAKSRLPFKWVVPKSAVPGEPVLFFVRAFGLVARGTIAGRSVPGTFGKRAVFHANVADCELLATPVPIAHVAAALPQWGWPTYPRAYTTAPEEVAPALLAILDAYQDGIVGEAEKVSERTEGRIHYTISTRYERDPNARTECILKHGDECVVCGFSFGGAYGDLVAGLIIVHHLVPVASRGGEHVVDPVQDLRPVCANCHLVIHRRNPPYSIEEVKMMLETADAADGEDGTDGSATPDSAAGG